MLVKLYNNWIRKYRPDDKDKEIKKDLQIESFYKERTYSFDDFLSSK